MPNPITSSENEDLNLSDKLTPLKAYELEKTQLYLNFIKWIVISGIFGWISLEFKQLIEDRKQGMSEIAVYNNYLQYVAGTKVTENYQVARFFAKVTATKDLRDGWKRYLDAIEPEYNIYKKKADSVDLVLENIVKQQNEKNGEGKKIDNVTIEKELQAASASRVKIEDTYNTVVIKPTEKINLSQATAYIQYVDNHDAAMKLSDLLRSFGCIVPAVEKILDRSPNRFEIRYFNLADRLYAEELQSRLNKAGFNFVINPIFRSGNTVKSGLIELWIK